MHPNSSLLRVVFVCSLVLTLVGCAPKSPGAPAGGAQGTVYKIGFLASITGSGSSLGEPERDSALMVQKQLDARGGITGSDGVLHPVKLLIYDTQSSGDVTITVAKKLLNDEGVVAIVGTTLSAEAMALIPVMQEAKVPLMSMASSSAIVEPVAERQWIFKSAQSNKHTAPWQVKYAKAKGLTKIANFYVNNAYGEDGAVAIRDAAKAEGLSILLEDTFGANDTDMTAQLTKLKASGAQALLVTATPPAASILTKQFREMGISIPIIHNHGIGMMSFITQCGESVAEGVIFPMGKMVAVASLDAKDPQKPVLEAFLRDFQQNSKLPPSTFAGHAWDGLQITLKALEKLPDGRPLAEHRTKLRDEIESIKGFVGTGGIFNLSAQDHVGLSSNDVVLARITKGNWEYLPPEKW
jgi:branched-chain amino acid transport system substrate-binding protein